MMCETNTYRAVTSIKSTKAYVATTTAGAHYWAVVLEGEAAPSPMVCRFPALSVKEAIQGAFKAMLVHIRDGRTITVVCSRDSLVHQVIREFGNARLKPTFSTRPQFAPAFIHAESLARTVAQRTAA